MIAVGFHDSCSCLSHERSLSDYQFKEIYPLKFSIYCLNKPAHYSIMADTRKRLAATRLIFFGSLTLLIGIFLALEVLPRELEFTQRQNLDVDKGIHNPSPTQTFDTSFFRETDTGKAIFEYLRCVDFDCFELEKKIGKKRAETTIPLIQLLQHGLPPEITSEVPGDIRPRVIRLLGVVADVRAATPLMTVLQDTNPVVRAGAADALGKIGGIEAFNALLPLLQDPDPLVRETTATALGRTGYPQALRPLRSAAERETQSHIRKAIEEAIRKIDKR